VTRTHTVTPTTLTLCDSRSRMSQATTAGAPQRVWTHGAGWAHTPLHAFISSTVRCKVWPLSLSTADMRREWRRVKPQGPITSLVVSHRLSGVLADIFNTSLSQETVPHRLRGSRHLPWNDKSPVQTMTTRVLWETGSPAHWKQAPCQPGLPPASRAHRSTEEVLSAQPSSGNTDVRMRCVDFSSAFSTPLSISFRLVKTISAQCWRVQCPAYKGELSEGERSQSVAMENKRRLNWAV